MTNLRGVILEHELTSITTENSYITQDISSLGIIAPFTLSMRFRNFAIFGSSGDDWAIGMHVLYGGSDDIWQQFLIISPNNGTPRTQYQINVSSFNTYFTDNPGSLLTGFSSTDDKDWRWLQLEINEPNDAVLRHADDPSITIPSGWDDERSISGLDITAESVIQTLRISNYLDSVSTSKSVMRTEIDEIILTQD